MRRLSQADVLQALADVVVPGDLYPVAVGLIQDVVIEWHDQVASVAIHVDQIWGDGPPPAVGIEAVCQRVRQLPAVAEVRVGPRSRERADQARNFARPSSGEKQVAQPTTQVVAVLSGKGGVGKSTVATNLAVALAGCGWRTALLDGDIYGYGVLTCWYPRASGQRIGTTGPTYSTRCGGDVDGLLRQARIGGDVARPDVGQGLSPDAHPDRMAGT